ncbi:alpha-amylase-like [Haliotis rufescens]|uniref:alpha-amylase-like n=1 Tax=Haliotis rufescens TaxID=6454 RepID=UPI001EB0AB11|nr:alpha-amylase-like [Haliotis rufescens]
MLVAMSRVIIALVLVLCCALTASAVNFQRTIVAISKYTDWGQNIFLRGGHGDESIRIRHEVKTQYPQGFFDQTSEGDLYLGWGGAEETQGRYNRNTVAQGTPMMHTTNDHSFDHTNSSLLGLVGESLWLADLYMDCDQTDNGWFDFKGYMVDLRPGFNSEGWEHYIGETTCNVDGDDVDVPNTGNHHAKCGYFNLGIWNNGQCWAKKLDYQTMLFRSAWSES